MGKWCSRCETHKAREEFYTNPSRKDGLAVHCRPCHCEIQREIEHRHRAAVLELLGGECARCGITDARILAVDHRNGNGAAERRRGLVQVRFYKHILQDPSPYQLLCHNCNWIKRIEEDCFVAPAVEPLPVPGPMQLDLLSE